MDSTFVINVYGGQGNQRFQFMQICYENADYERNVLKTIDGTNSERYILLLLPLEWYASAHQFVPSFLPLHFLNKVLYIIDILPSLIPTPEPKTIYGTPVVHNLMPVLSTLLILSTTPQT